MAFIVTIRVVPFMFSQILAPLWVVTKKIRSSNDLSMYLLEQKAVVTVAGKAFGSDGNVRFSYAASDEDLSRAMDLLEETLTELE